MNVSAPFIHRPIATSLIGIAVLLGGILGYWWLPVSALPQVDFPTIQVTTQLPGANPQTMSAIVTAPLERQFGQIPSLESMTSSSSFGISQVTLKFNLDRDIDGAAQDVQAAINAAGSTLPRGLPYPPTYSKVNPADAPIITLALTSPTIPLRTLSDLADTRWRRGSRKSPASAMSPCRAASARRYASRPISAGSPPTASGSTTCAPPLPEPTPPGRRDRSTGRNSPTPSPPTTSSAPPRLIASSSSPIATARR